jgi:hypothetical protein
VVFLDVRTGQTIRRTPLFSPAVAAAVVHEEWIFCPAVGGRVWCIKIADGSAIWRIGTRGPIQLSPVYIPDEDLLVIADDHKGLRAAASKVFHATLQRCRVHWMRNALAYVAAKQRPAVIAMIKTIFAQETAQDAHAQWKSVADALRERAPKLAELMDEAREDVLAYTAFPKEHWPQIASTNPLERLNGEVKRRSNVVGIFPNDRAVIRLVGALMLEQNDEWAVSRRYMSLESLAPVSNDITVRLPGVAA